MNSRGILLKSGFILNYRQDIDGLRAIAVLSVILFHSGISVISGGFVGVDIFFVISGYLITTLIYREIKEESLEFFSQYAHKAIVIHPYKIFCENECLTNNENWSYFNDAHHVSMAATSFIVVRLKPLLKRAE